MCEQQEKQNKTKKRKTKRKLEIPQCIAGLFETLFCENSWSPRRQQRNSEWTPARRARLFCRRLLAWCSRFVKLASTLAEFGMTFELYLIHVPARFRCCSYLSHWVLALETAGTVSRSGIVAQVMVPAPSTVALRMTLSQPRKLPRNGMWFSYARKYPTIASYGMCSLQVVLCGTNNYLQQCSWT